MPGCARITALSVVILEYSPTASKDHPAKTVEVGTRGDRSRVDGGLVDTPSYDSALRPLDADYWSQGKECGRLSHHQPRSEKEN